MADHQGFEQTAVPQMNLLYNYALRLTMNSEDAKDLLQETYLKAYRFWNKFEEGTNIKGWLCRIMKNTYINLYRKKVKEPNKIEYDETHLYHDAHQHRSLDSKYQEGKHYHDVLGDEIARSIESLPNIFKTVILLSDFEELGYSKIAEIIACPVGTVRSRLHRGRKVLQQKLLSYATDNGYIEG